MEELEMHAENCCSEEKIDFYDMMERKLMAMTFWAHKQILFEKIKQKIEKTEGQKLDKLVDLVVEASKDEWKTDKEIDKKRKELKNKIKETFEAE